MKDRYLFRGKRLDNGEWIIGCLDIAGQALINTIDDCKVVDKDTIGQCTGLKDSKGNLIYEGDIVSGVNGSINFKDWEWGPYEIKWIDEESKFNVPGFGTLENQNSTHWYDIIGNIHQPSDI